MAEITLSDSIEHYKNHPLVKELNLTNDEFNSNFSAIKRMVDDQEECDKSPDHCFSNSNIHIILKRDKNNRLFITSIYCPKMLKIQQSRQFANNYLYYSFPNRDLDLSLTKKYFDNITDDNKRQLITKFLKSIKYKEKIEGCYIYGAFGVGKTYLATALANDLARTGYKVAFCFVPNLVFDIKQHFKDEDTKFSKDIINKFISADVLFLDDLGAEKTSEWFYRDHLMVILNARMQNKKPTFFTSNLSLKHLNSKLCTICGPMDGGRISQRIIACCNNNEKEIKGENLRLKK